MKKFIALLLCFLFVFGLTTVAYASDSDDEIIYRYNNTESATTSFAISSTGYATVKNSYKGRTGYFQSATITTKVQKKVGIIWVTVSGGSWTDNSTSTNYSKSHSVQLSSTGTYRAHVVFVISGTGGSDDKITKNVQKTYS
ncbi:MAG: hypothetical protein E7570_04555 [Ruminococcaceae bacterium]|nr:hypothetical protein [Oscillospiraceae bacterium]